ncbi:hypothetical protein D3C75_803040 [compost metagenome]
MYVPGQRLLCLGPVKLGRGGNNDIPLRIDQCYRCLQEFSHIVTYRLNPAVFKHHRCQGPVDLLRTAQEHGLAAQQQLHYRLGDIRIGDFRRNLHNQQAADIARLNGPLRNFLQEAGRLDRQRGCA